ncbi:DUF421 domain-containing protein [Dyadobacter psychrotolerans]|uniref:DUF421 domain-containing protein n=1 Tax=Dyadobacter psychrotolerans TaxID=2541721 RepID=A0A4R5DUB6_9BACT|nr:YetF domain-containing protein [Dyadobacter psychrotolerans]TDE17367.1 DUF421 domain-containing protein [Dyadobacter psychrotolerans]
MDWQELFINDLDWEFAFEIILRTLIMFALILVFLRISGKKGVKQLSIFEVAIIIGLGSAAGDPMSNKDNAIVPALLVFATILGFYRLVTWFAMKNEKFESVLEGDPVYIIEDGRFNLDTGDETYAKDEFFSEMRQQSIEHLGQVRTAVLEPNGNVSFLYYQEDQVKSGLPVMPKLYKQKIKNISSPADYACSFCGNTEHIEEGPKKCNRCGKDEWVKALDTPRLS